MALIFDFVYFFINYVVAFLPSRKLRSIIYFILSKGKISLQSTIAMNVKILDIRGVIIKKNSNINAGSILDGRGATLTISENVDIASNVSIWTCQHDVNTHSTNCSDVHVGKNVWIASGSTVLPNVTIGDNSVIASSSVVSRSVYKNTLSGGIPAKKIRDIKRDIKKLDPIRRFR